MKALIKAKNSTVVPAAAEAATTSAAADMPAARAVCNSSPANTAGLSAPSLQHVASDLEHRASNLSVYSNLLPGLQHALSGLGNTALNSTLSIKSSTFTTEAGSLRSQSATGADCLGRWDAANAAAQQRQYDASFTGRNAPECLVSKLGMRAVAAGDADGAGSPQTMQHGTSDASCTTRLAGAKRSQLAAKAQQMFSLLGQLSQLQQQQQLMFGTTGPAASADTPSGLTGGDVDCIMSSAAETTAAMPSAAQCSARTVPRGCTYQPAELKRVLEDVVNNKKQAAACVREAVALGLLPQVLLQSLRQAMTPSESEIAAAIAMATGRQQQQQPAVQERQVGSKRPRSLSEDATEPNCTPAADEPSNKLNRLANGLGAVNAAVELKKKATAVIPADLQPIKKLDRTLSNGSTSTDVTAAAATEAAAPARTHEPQNLESQQKQQQHMDAASTDHQPAAARPPAESASAADSAIRDLPQIWSKISAAAAAAAPPVTSLQQAKQAQQLMQQQQQVMSPAAHALFARIMMVMSQSQRLCKQLAYMVLPAAQEAQDACQQLQQHQQAVQAATTLDIQGLQALQGAVQQLKQQLLYAKLMVNSKQQAIVRMQQELQAATAAHVQQLEVASQAVGQLMAVANGDGLRRSDKEKIIDIAASILSAAVVPQQQPTQ